MMRRRWRRDAGEAVTRLAAKKIGYAERARFYDLEYEEPVSRDFYASLITPRVASVLEVPCGAGNNTLHLCRPGLRFVAVDREPTMIERLRERISEAPSRFADLELVVGDMRDLDLGERFDLILVQREAFQLILDRQQATRALRSLARHLATGGALVIDLSTFEESRERGPALETSYFDPTAPDGKIIREWTHRLSTGADLERSRRQYHRADGSILVTYDYRWREPSGAAEEWTMDMPLATYSKDSFLALLESADLSPRHIYRNYQRDAVVPGSVRMIFIVGVGRA